jgi:hypothetical protein
MSATQVIAVSGTTDSNLRDYLQQNDAIVIKHGNGGVVLGMMITLNYMRDNPTKTVVVDGPCYSACTMLLTVPNTLWTRNARFYFHSTVRNFCTDGVYRTEINEQTNAQVLQMFPRDIQNWIISSKAFQSTNFVLMPDDLLRRTFKGRGLLPAMLPDFVSQRIETPTKPTNLVIPGDCPT